MSAIFTAMAVSAFLLATPPGTSAIPTPTPSIGTPTAIADCPFALISPIADADPQVATDGYGGAPLWAVGGIGPAGYKKAISRTGTPVPGELPYTGPQFAGPTKYGWFIKVRWLLPVNAKVVVRVSGVERSSGAPIRVQKGQGGAVTVATFDPAVPEIPLQHGGQFWEFPSYVYFPRTGCYTITATWAGGSWTATIPFVSPPDSRKLATPAPESQTKG